MLPVSNWALATGTGCWRRWQHSALLQPSRLRTATESDRIKPTHKEEKTNEKIYKANYKNYKDNASDGTELAIKYDGTVFETDELEITIKTPSVEIEKGTYKEDKNDLKITFGNKDVTSSSSFEAICNVATAVATNGTLTVSNIQDGKDTIEVQLNATYTHEEIEYSRTVTFIINRLLGVTDIYEIHSNLAVIKKGKDKTLTCQLKKTNSSGSSLIDYNKGWGDDKLVLQYQIDGTANTTEYTNSFDITDCDSVVDLQLLYDNNVIDTESIPVIYDGEAGNTPTAFFQSFVFCRSNI